MFRTVILVTTNTLIHFRTFDFISTMSIQTFLDFNNRAHFACWYTEQFNEVFGAVSCTWTSLFQTFFPPNSNLLLAYMYTYKVVCVYCFSKMRFPKSTTTICNLQTIKSTIKSWTFLFLYNVQENLQRHLRHWKIKFFTYWKQITLL